MPKIVAQAAKTAPRRVFPAGRLSYLEHCHWKGMNAQEVGFDRVSPYYEDLEADLYWFAGFDGFSFEAVMQIHSEPSKETPHEVSH